MARVPSEGATLSYGVNPALSPQVWVSFAYVTELPSPSSTKPELDATALEDTASTFFLGKVDYGSLTVQFFMDPASSTQYSAAMAAQLAGTLWRWKITDPKSVTAATVQATHIFSARIRELTTGRTVNGMVTGTMTLRVSGAVAFTRET